MEGKWVSVTLTATADHLTIYRLLDMGISLSLVSYPLLSKPGCNEYLQTCGHIMALLKFSGSCAKTNKQKHEKENCEEEECQGNVREWLVTLARCVIEMHQKQAKLIFKREKQEPEHRSVIKNIHFFFKGPEFSCQHPHERLHLPVIQVIWDLIHASKLCIHCIHMLHLYIGRHNNTHEIKINL